MFVSFGALLLYLVYKNQSNSFLEQCLTENGPEANCDYLEKILNDLKQAKISWVILSVLLYILSNIIRAARWQMLFKPLGYNVSFANSFFATMIGYMVNLGLPRAGEIAKIAALSRNENIEIEKVAGTIVVDRSMDFICLFIMILLGVLFEYDAIVGFVMQEGSFPFEYLPLLLVPLAGFIWFMRIRKTSQNKFILKINGLVEGFSAGVMSVFKMKNKILFLLYSVGIWLCYYLMTYVVFFSFPPTAHLSPVAGLVVFVFGALGMVIPTPGGAGSYHYLIAKGLELYGVTDGFVLANIIFIPIQLVGNIILGVISYALLPSFRKTNEKE